MTYSPDNTTDAPDDTGARYTALPRNRSAITTKNGRTRCSECLARLAYTDWQDPEKVIREHRTTDCSRAIVAPLPRSRSAGAGRPRRIR